MINRIKQKIQERQEEQKNAQILEDLRQFYNHKTTVYWLCKKYNIPPNRQIYISYQLRNLTRKVNLAIKLEEEERIQKMDEITKYYIDIFKKEI